jgi:hypothetical protein
MSVMPGRPYLLPAVLLAACSAVLVLASACGDGGENGIDVDLECAEEG